jgi:cytochrome c
VQVGSRSRRLLQAAALGLVMAMTAGAAMAQAPVAAGDPVAGEQAFVLCGACHNIGPGAENSVGPVLNGVVGRKAGTFPGFEYSDANKQSAIVWDEKTLAAYLPDPTTYLPGTSMPIGLSEPKDVADVIAYLRLFDAQGKKAAAAN